MELQEFLDDRLGLFIHFGPYSVAANINGAEWIRSAEELSVEAYQKYVERFDPQEYDPVAWAKLAKQAGVKYAVMTAKHHDGYCLFNSRFYGCSQKVS